MKIALVAGLLLAVLMCASPALSAVGFQQVQVADPGSKPLTVFLWYPTTARPKPMAAGPYVQSVAANAPLAGEGRPLIVLSHGSSGSPFNHYDLALALAEAGFVVAAPLHTGDNYADSRDAGFRRDLLNRPRHLSLTIDYALKTWPEHARVDPGRVGVFGFSLGGLAALTVAGGTPDFQRIVQHCVDRPDAVECQFIRAQHGDQLDPNPPRPAWPRDPRIKAVVVAAPAVTLAFGPKDLARVRAPVQLWRGAADQNVPDRWNTALVRRELPTPPQEHVVAKAGHFVFVAPCGAAFAKQAPSICDDPAGVDRVAFHRAFNRAVVTFFRAHLDAGR